MTRMLITTLPGSPKEMPQSAVANNNVSLKLHLVVEWYRGPYVMVRGLGASPLRLLRVT